MPNDSTAQEAHRTQDVDAAQGRADEQQDRANFLHLPAATTKRLAGQADTVAALLSVIHILPAPDRHNALRTCAALARELADDVAALTGGAA